MMDGTGETLLTMDKLASRFGVALNPKLRAALMAYQQALPEGVVALPVAPHSAGPAHQVVTPSDIAQPRVTRLNDHRRAKRRQIVASGGC